MVCVGDGTGGGGFGGLTDGGLPWGGLGSVWCWCRWFGWFGGRGDKTVLFYIV